MSCHFINFLYQYGYIDANQKTILHKNEHHLDLALTSLHIENLNTIVALKEAYISHYLKNIVYAEIPHAVCIAYKIIPICRYNDRLVIATTDFIIPQSVLDKYVPNSNIEIIVVPDNLILNYLNIECASQDKPTQIQQLNKMNVHNMLIHILQKALHNNASDIHFSHDTVCTRCKYRIDGQLHIIYLLSPAVWSKLCMHIKVISKLDIAEKRAPQDGYFNRTIAYHLLNCRVSIQPTTLGENLVIRIHNRASRQSFAMLGYPSHIIDIFNKFIQAPTGMLLVTGPSGSGKTTAAHEILQCIQDYYHHSQNIMSLEDPVEHDLTDIQQTSLQSCFNMTFASGLRAILRQDPDVIFIGEIRDEETAQIAIRAAITGHKIISTVHSASIISTIHRLQNLGLNDTDLPYITAIVSQVLVKKFCTHCKKSDQTHAMKGCQHCHYTGYEGRTVISEGVCNPIHILKTKQPYITLSENAYMKVAHGITSHEIIAPYIDDLTKT